MILRLSAFAMDGPLEYQVKAAFLLNFTKFVQWPATAFAAADSPIAICVWGNDPFGKVLDEIVAEEVVDGRKVVVRRIKGTSGSAGLPGVVCERDGKGGAREPVRAGAGSVDDWRRRGVCPPGRNDRLRRREPPRAVRNQRKCGGKPPD